MTPSQTQTKIRLSYKKKILFSLIVLLFFCAIAEMAARVICWQRFSSYHTSIAIQGNSRWQKDPVLIWENRPFYLETDLSSQYNEKGMRVNPGNVEFPQKAKNEVRIFLLGGSAMAGMGSALNGDWLKITGIPTHQVKHSIDGYLQKILSKAWPNKKVTVYNTSVASSTIIQSRLNYNHYLRHLQPDWIISMDGVNDLHALSPNQDSYLTHYQDWQQSKIYRFPFREGRLLMRNSALMFLIGEYLFFKSGIIRNSLNTPQNKSVHDYWLKQQSQSVWSPLKKTSRPQIHRAVADFCRNLALFKQMLEHDQQKHLLLIQPHLSFRDPSKVSGTEQAVYNYYCHSHPKLPDNFLYHLYQEVSARYSNSKQVVPMQAVHSWEQWVFVDYCHFTKEANRRIAQELARYILSDGEVEIFAE